MLSSPIHCNSMNCSTPRLPCPSPYPKVCSNSCPVSRWCHPTISSFVAPFSSRPQSFPASRSFPVSQLFASSGQSIGATAPIQGRPPLGLSGLISLQSKGLWRVFSNTTVQKHQFFSTQLSSQSNSHIQTSRTSIHDYLKNHSLDYTDNCRQNDVSAF